MSFKTLIDIHYYQLYPFIIIIIDIINNDTSNTYYINEIKIFMFIITQMELCA